MTVTIRPAHETDIPNINQLHRPYVENTVITFSLVPKTDTEALESFRSIVSAGLPYIVAVDADTHRIVGFSYCSPFRGSKGGYMYTAELTLFIDKEEQGKGIGSILLKKLIEIESNPSDYLEFFAATKEPRRVRALLACMAVDVTGKNEGLALKAFYEKFGFELVGHLKNVGYKFGRWYIGNPSAIGKC
jgi:L-amino acid N-acyltransferase YncA